MAMQRMRRAHRSARAPHGADRSVPCPYDEQGRPMTDAVSIDDVLARVGASRRYRWVAEAVVARLAEEEIPKARNLADAEKRTKRRLHQIFGAYTGQPDYARLL